MIVLITAALLFSFAALKFFIAPYLWIFLSWSLVCIYVVRYAGSTPVKIIAVNLGTVFFILVSTEGFLYARSGQPYRDEIRNQDGKIINRNIEHQILGWAPVKSQALFWKRYFGDTLLFDITHTIDNHGLRISPGKSGTHAPACILFFGGSFTFGAGVNDDETMPYLVGSRYPETYRVYNFGYSGYGAHQMLAALQHQIVDSAIDCQPKYAIYLAISDHVGRSANKALWISSGPKYVLGEDDKANYSGQFETGSRSFTARMKEQLFRSLIVRLLLEHYYVTSDDIKLLVAIVDASRRLVEQRYAGSEFHVLIWDDESWVSSEMAARLNEKEIRTHSVSDILPDFLNQKQNYVLSKEDEHPNQRAHKALAEFVSEKIVRE